ncbi:MAG: MATE family efflux transporter [Lachnospiraceae bacterium]|nr:MATE family efflux transporter [Lachnospiraceae bacterium]
MDHVIDKRVFYKKLWTLALPIAFQSLMASAVAAGDAFMLGRIAQSEMTAVSLASQVQFVQNMFIFAVTGAGSILGAQYFGKGDTVTLKKIFNLMIRFTTLISIIFFLSCMFIPEVLMMAFTSEPVLIGIGSDYLRIAGFSYLIMGLSQSYLAMMKVSDHVLASVIISSTAVVGNILLNAVFIFGLFGIPAMNARGAAIATVMARVIELTLCFIVASGKGHIRPNIRIWLSEKGLTKDFLKQLFPLLGGSLLWGVGFTAYTAIIGHMGEDASAANSVVAVVRELICCVCNGIGSAAAIMVGNELGAGDLEKGKAYGLKLKNLSWIIGFASSGVVLAVTPLIANMVKLSDKAGEYLTGMMLITVLYMIGRCVNTITINGVLDGGGDTVFDMYSLAVSMWGIALPLALLGAFAFDWPVLAVFACTCLDEVGKIPWVMIRLRKYKWVKNLTR